MGYTFSQEKLDLANFFLKKHPDRVPIILETTSQTKKLLKRTKFLVPLDVTFQEFCLKIRREHLHSSVGPSESLIFLCRNTTLIPSCQPTMQDLYLMHKERDNFLYIQVCLENTFGSEEEF